MRRLAAQNPWVNVKEWCLFHETIRQEPEARLLVFGVDQHAETAILSKGNKLNYSFAALIIRVQKAVKNTSYSAVTRKQPARVNLK